MLENGSIIMGWVTKEKGAEWPGKESFDGLKVGGELPKLPGEISGFRFNEKVDDKSDEVIRWVGRHLAVTELNGEFYEWSLYVPTSEIPFYEGIRNYAPFIKRHPGGWKDPANYRTKRTFGIFTIRSNEFDTYIRGAMAELSDDGVVPEHVTYENVVKLTEEIRASMEQ